MTQEQEKQVKRKVIEILISEDYKNSACTQNSPIIVQEVLDDMQADNVQHITDAVIMQYFQSVFFDKEMILEKVKDIREMIKSNGVLNQEPKSSPETAKFSTEVVKRLAWKIGRLWRIEVGRA